MDAGTSSSPTPASVDDYLVDPSVNVGTSGTDVNAPLPWYRYKEEHAHEITTPPPKYNVEELGLKLLPTVPLTDQQRAEIEAGLNVTVTAVPPKEAQKDWRCVPKDAAPAAPTIVAAVPGYKWSTKAEPLGCAREIKRKATQLTEKQELLREEGFIPDEFENLLILHRAAAIKLQRRFRAYGARTWRKVRLLREMKKRLDEEERVRQEEENRRREEEEKRKKEEEERAIREAERAIEEARKKKEEARLKKIEADRLAQAALQAATDVAATERERGLAAALGPTPQPTVVPTEKGKGVAQDDDDVQILETEYFAEATGTDEDRREIKRKIELLKAGCARGLISDDLCKSGIIHIRDSNRWPAEFWEKTFDYDVWDAKRQANRKAISVAVADVNASLEASAEVREGQGADEDVVESRPKKASTKGPATSKKAAAKAGTPALILTKRRDGRKRFIDNAFKIYKDSGDRNVFPERPFHPNVLQNKDFQMYIAERGLRKMVNVQGHASFELTREFYANLAAKYEMVDELESGNPMEFTMRGVDVDFSPQRINDHFNRIEIPADLAAKHDASMVKMDIGMKEGSWASVTAICETNDEDVYHNHPRTLVRWKCTPAKYKSWLEWVGSNVYVTARVTEMPNRLYFIWNELRQAHPIDLGKQIQASMIRMALNNKMSMGHTHLIRDMCKAQGVPVDDAELTIPPGRQILLRKEWLDLTRWAITQPTVPRGPPSQRPAPPKRKALALPAPRTSKKPKATQTVDVGPSTRQRPSSSTPAEQRPPAPSSSRLSSPLKHVHRKVTLPDPLPTPPTLPDLPNATPFEKAVLASLNYLQTASAQQGEQIAILTREINRTSRGVANVDTIIDKMINRHMDLRQTVKDLAHSVKLSHYKAFESFDWPSESEDEGGDPPTPTHDRDPVNVEDEPSDGGAAE